MKKEKREKREKLSSRWSLQKPLYIKPDDDRYELYVDQLRENGFADNETWSLYNVIAEFVLPRLKRFREIKNGYPSNLKNDKEWQVILDKIIFALEWANKFDDIEVKLSQKEQVASWTKYNEGMRLFSEYFTDLWW